MLGYVVKVIVWMKRKIHVQWKYTSNHDASRLNFNQASCFHWRDENIVETQSIHETLVFHMAYHFFDPWLALFWLSYLIVRSIAEALTLEDGHEQPIFWDFG